jgi:hypothetical protein
MSCFVATMACLVRSKECLGAARTCLGGVKEMVFLSRACSVAALLDLRASKDTDDAATEGSADAERHSDAGTTIIAAGRELAHA